MTKKALLTKYGTLAKDGASAIEVKNAITQAEKDLTPEDVDEIVLTVFEDPANDPEPAIPEEQPAPAPSVQSSAAGVLKKKYDIYRGQWHATKAVTGLDGKEVVVEWEFRKEGKPLKTGVPMEPEKAEYFNAGKRLRIGKCYTEQIIEVGYTGKVLDKLPNPFQVRDIVY